MGSEAKMHKAIVHCFVRFFMFLLILSSLVNADVELFMVSYFVFSGYVIFGGVCWYNGL